MSVQLEPVAEWGNTAENFAHAPQLLKLIHPVRLMPFSHPYVCKVREILRRHGVRGIRDYALVDPALVGPLQERSEDYLPALEKNSAYVVNTELLDEFEFQFGGAYSVYNWELFFHTPMLIASWLSKSGRHEEAHEWMHAVFNPIDVDPSDPLRDVWRFKPFREVQTEAELIAQVNSTNPPSEVGKWLRKALGGEVAEFETTLEKQIDEWEIDPFNPHLLARMRPIAYMKWTVRVYIDNLIAWGDKLFRQDSAESIVEALQLYMLAARILGNRPQPIDSPDAPHAGKTFAEMKLAELDDLTNPLVKLESALTEVNVNQNGPNNQSVGELLVPYFCIPINDQLLSLWDIVADRLFKIRHCLNIEGVARELPLFEPPIDPALLVRARAAGLDIASVLSDLYAPPPLHRFGFLYQRAVDFASFVAQLGAQLLATLEKKDAEALAVLRSSHEVSLLDQIRETRGHQVRESEEALLAIRRSRSVVEERQQHYSALLADSPSPGVIGRATADERKALELGALAKQAQRRGSDEQALASNLFMIPQFGIGASIPALQSTTFGGQQVGNYFMASATRIHAGATETRDEAALTTTMAGYHRRAEEWNLQLALAEAELRQIDKQLVAAEIRVEIARSELANHDKQIAQAREVRDFLEDKYTREELYGWMVRELQTTYHRAYKLAFDMARRAERAYQYERLEPEARFVEFGHWDGVRKGLLAGEKLLLDLRRMEATYLERDRREYEITKHVSLAEHAPLALLTLRETGSVTIQLSEALFDMDYPGHYHRRIKNVSLTLPAVAGPYSSVSCTLTLLSNKIRSQSQVGGGYREDPTEGDPRFRYRVGAIASVATSQAIEDSGTFELTFSGDRRLPFEGSGAISTWRIELPAATNRFDLSTLSDVVLRVQYTARDGGGMMREAALAEVLASPLPMARRMLSARDELGAAWTTFWSELDGSDRQVMSFTLDGKTPFIPGRGPLRLGKVVAALDLDAIDPTAVDVPADFDLDQTSVTGVPLRDASVATAVVNEAGPAIEIEGKTIAITIDPAVVDPALTESHPLVPGKTRLKRSLVRDIVLVFFLERDAPLA
jgi:hypothetical protein